jgi:hypothetical protein
MMGYGSIKVSFKAKISAFAAQLVNTLLAEVKAANKLALDTFIGRKTRVDAVFISDAEVQFFGGLAVLMLELDRVTVEGDDLHVCRD